MNRNSATLAVIAAAALVPAISGCAPTRAITERAVLEYATTPYERSFPKGREVLGALNAGFAERFETHPVGGHGLR